MSQRRNDGGKGPQSQRSLQIPSGFSTRKPGEFCGKEKGIGVVDSQNRVTLAQLESLGESYHLFLSIKLR